MQSQKQRMTRKAEYHHVQARQRYKHSVKDDHAFLRKHAIFRHLPSRNPETDQDEI
jgi:hypothetical protein